VRRPVTLVARREVVEGTRSRTFVVSTAISLVVIVVIAVLPALLRDDGPTTYDVGGVGASTEQLEESLDGVVSSLPDDADVVVDVTAFDDEAAARAAVEDGDVDAVVLPDGSVLVQEELGDELATILQLATVDELPSPLDVEAIDPPDDDRTEREGLMFVGTILLYGQLIGFGVWVATSIVEEKSSRVVELLLAKARPRPLLAGKIIGTGLIGFGQLLLFVVVGLAVATLAGSVDLPPSTARIAVELLAWFVLGYALYSCLFAVGGALASRSEELQATTGPVTMVTMVSFFAAIAAGGDPGSTVARIATFFPPSAPMVLPIRSAAGELPVWEAVVSVALVLLSIVATVRLAAKAYEGAAMHVRGQMRLRDALRSG
jgi:ABC-2 type transport system permease protein